MGRRRKNAPQEPFSLLYFGRAIKNQLSACHWVGFFIFSAASSSNHTSPFEARVLGKGRRRKNAPQEPFSLLYFGRATKKQLSACHWVGFFIFSAASSSNHASPFEARVLGKGRRRKNAPQEPFSLLYFGRATKNQLSACHWVGFFIFSATSSSNHASPSEARVLGKGRRRKNAPQEPFSLLYFGRATKNQLSACHWVGFFIFSATSSSNHASPFEARVLGKGRRRKNAPQEPFSLLYFGRATKKQLSACHWVGFFIFSAASSSNHASPFEARVLGKGRRRKNAPQEPFSLLYFGRATKTNLVLVTGLVFLFFPLPHPPITLRLLRLAFLGRDVVGKTLHRSLFLSSTSGVPQKPT